MANWRGINGETKPWIVLLLAILAMFTLMGLGMAAPDSLPVRGLDQVIEAHHISWIILGIAVALLLGGKNLAEFLSTLTKKGGTVTVNVEDQKVHEKAEGRECQAGLVNPTLCPDHKAEHERSKRNEANIGLLFDKLDDLRADLQDIKDLIIKALSSKER